MTDTIYAVSSAPGKAGIAVVRVSGPAAKQSLSEISRHVDFESRRAVFTSLVNPVSCETIDRAVVIFFESPGSFTGEDVAEYFVHGGAAVIADLISALSGCPGHRMAEPGEFTRRAFENGKLDLTEAEAVADLIDAQTRAQKLQALSQLDGALSRLYDDWRDELTKALAYLEAAIDFPDEELPEGILAAAAPALEKLAGEIAAHLDDNRRGERLRDGIQVAVIGAPNAGKSSLVNALAKRDVAIVSEYAGTTRDIIEVHLDLGGFPVILSDTAGLRPDQLGTGGQAAIESEGIRRALERARQADLKLLVFDGSALPALDRHTAELIDANGIIVINKADLLKGPPPVIGGATPLLASARTGAGLDGLIEALTEKISQMIVSRETPSLTRQRHREALTACRESLTRALAAGEPELMAEDVRLAVRALGRITGRVDVEDLLDVIFRDFCIGK